MIPCTDFLSNKIENKHWCSFSLFACTQVNFIAYADELSFLIGAKPNLWHLLRTDPELAFRCFFGPCVPAQYRLVGPGTWQGARDIIMGVQESKRVPLRTRETGPKSEGTKMGFPQWLLTLLVAVIIYVLVYNK